MGTAQLNARELGYWLLSEISGVQESKIKPTERLGADLRIGEHEDDWVELRATLEEKVDKDITADNFPTNEVLAGCTAEEFAGHISAFIAS